MNKIQEILSKINNKWHGKAFRSPTGYRHGNDVTAGDVVRYEQDELGNDYGLGEQELNYLDKFPATQIMWVTRTKSPAKRYGSPRDINVEGWRIVAEDGDGGYLVLNDRPNEEFLTTLPSKYRKDKTFDIWKNPTSNEFHQFIRSTISPSLNEFNIRFIIDVGRNNLYVWDANYALHADIYRELGDEIGDKYIGGTIDTVYRGEYEKGKKIVFDPMSSSYDRPIDLITATGSKFRKFMNMDNIIYEINYEKFKVVDGRIQNIREEYVGTATSNYGNIDVYRDSPSFEIARLLKSSQLGSLRFIMNKREDYLIFDAVALHSDMMNKRLAPDFVDKDLKGQIFKDKLYVYQHSAYIFFLGLPKGKYDENIPQNADGLCAKEIEKTVLYSNLKKLGITSIEIGKWM